MNNFQKILNSFSVKESLNPKVWENPKNLDQSVMIPKVRETLSRIAEKFIEYLGDEVFVEDVYLMGSLANYNWSEFSDFDLHVIIDFHQYENQSELYKELFELKKKVFNDKYNLQIFGYDVEVYAQDFEEPYYSSGVYSIMNNEWIHEPKKFKNNIDKEVLTKKLNVGQKKLILQLMKVKIWKKSKKN